MQHVTIASIFATISHGARCAEASPLLYMTPPRIHIVH